MLQVKQQYSTFIYGWHYSLHSSLGLHQGCPTRDPLKILMQPSDNFQFSGYNEGYEKEFRETTEKHLGRKSINKR